MQSIEGYAELFKVAKLKDGERPAVFWRSRCGFLGEPLMSIVWRQEGVSGTSTRPPPPVTRSTRISRIFMNFTKLFTRILQGNWDPRGSWEVLDSVGGLSRVTGQYCGFY